MKKATRFFVFVLVILSLLLVAGCAQQPAATPAATEEPAATEAPMAEEVSVVIGFTSSLTGSQEVSSKR